MADVFDKAKRSQVMSRIRGKDTKPEILIRKILHSAGFRFRLHQKHLPGKPDIVLAKHNAAVFVHGCFWHGHDCHLAKYPDSNKDFWRTKISLNQARDKKHLEELSVLGVKTCVIWECALRGRHKRGMEEILNHLVKWLNGTAYFNEIRGMDVSEKS